jgi:hypothetical protein
MNTHRTRWAGVVSAVVLSCLALCPAARAQSFTINWYTIDAGGGTSVGGAYTLTATIGQFDAGAPMSGGPFLLEAGYWPGLSGPPPCRADFNNDTRVNSQDFFDFLGAFFAQHPSADFNADRAINSQDFFDFLAVFFAGCP